MDKTEQLVIRACKSLNPDRRLQSVYRRFYFSGGSDHSKVGLARILSRVCDTYLNVPMSTLLNAFHPDNRCTFGADETDDYWSSVIKFLTQQIRLSERARFPGLTPPAMFRVKGNE